MNRLEELQIADCQDVWSKLYVYYARTFVGGWAQQGETVLREAIRAYGVDRGTALRKKQEEHGLEINVKNLFTYYDLPDDPRFRRNKIKLTVEERFSETLVCPIADLWKGYEAKKLGRIYCEEFHHAMFEAYEHAFQINLGETLTQDEDNHCRFSVYGRPANIPEGAFHKGTGTSGDFIVPDYRHGFETLVIRLSFRMLQLALIRFGEKAETPFAQALQQFSDDIAKQMRRRASALALPISKDFVDRHCPISILQDRPYAEWETYITLNDEHPWNMFYGNVILPLRHALLFL